MTDNNNEVILKVEALLFAYGNWLSIESIKSVLEGESETKLKNILSDLKEKYKEGFPFEVKENSQGEFRMELKEEFDDLTEQLISGTEIPGPVLRVLSVIAYEQPVTKTRLSEILGRSVKEEIDYLYKHKFLDYEKHGLGRYYRVTRKFYDYFAIEDTSEFVKEANKTMNTFIKESEDIVKEIDEKFSKENGSQEDGESEIGNAEEKPETQVEEFEVVAKDVESVAEDLAKEETPESPDTIPKSQDVDSVAQDLVNEEKKD